MSSDTLRAHTRQVFERRYGKPLSDAEVESIIRSAMRFLEALQ